MKKIFFAVASVLLSVAGLAEVANPEPLKVKQSDGTMLTIQLHGDEFSSHTTTIDGYTVVKCDDNTYRYAMVENGVLVATDIIAHEVDERDAVEMEYCLATEKHLEGLSPMMAKAKSLQKKEDEVKPSELQGTLDRTNFRGLVILVNYTDRKFDESNAKEMFNDMINKDHYSGYQDEKEGWQTYTGSVRDYFRDSSMGTFIPEFDVVGPVDINYSQYDPARTSNAKNIMRAVLDAADPYVDFTKYDGDDDGRVDMFFVIFAGYGSSNTGNDERLMWPHASTLTSTSVKHDGMYFYRYACGVEKYGWNTATRHDNVLCGIGTICHEFSHVLGLHDHYDTSKQGTVTPGTWDIMASGNHNNKGRIPPAYNMYEREVLGMGVPELITEEGIYTLSDLTSSNKAYKIQSGVSTEHFIIENRQKVKWDASMEGKGMLIWRVDSSNVSLWEKNDVNTMPDHPLFELVRAMPDTKSSSTKITDSAGDPFPGSGKVTTISNSTTPSLRSWNGTECEFLLTGIKEVDGEMTFTVTKEEPQSFMETFAEMGSFAKTNLVVKDGTHYKWTFVNAGVKAVTGYKQVTGNAVEMYKGSHLTSGNIENGVESMEYVVANSSTMPTLVSTYFSADNGETWQKIGVSTMFNAKEEKSIKLPAIDLPANSMVRIMIESGSTLTPVFVDNINIKEGLHPTGINRLPSPLKPSNKGRVVYRFGDNVIRALNGHKYVAK